jgi:hypothetical protein
MKNSKYLSLILKISTIMNIIYKLPRKMYIMTNNYEF